MWGEEGDPKGRFGGEVGDPKGRMWGEEGDPKGRCGRQWRCRVSNVIVIMFKYLFTKYLTILSIRTEYSKNLRTIR